MNLLTNYLDKKYNRTYGTIRNKIILQPTCKELYYTTVGEYRRKPIFTSDLPTDIPILLMNFLDIVLSDKSIKMGFKYKPLDVLSMLDERMTPMQIKHASPICNTEVPEEVPSLYITIAQYLEDTKILPVVEAEEEEEIFEFI